MAKKSTRRLTRDDLSLESRCFWQERGLLDKLPMGLLVALDRELEREAQGWREQIVTEFGPGSEGRRRGRRT